MKRKLFLLLCALLTMIGVQAQETPTNDGIYYLYNSETDLFLSRGNDWGTQAVANPVALPWKVSISDGNYTLRMYDLTVAGSTTGFGSNGFTDNGSPIQFTPSGNATDGFTLKNGNNYITCPASAGVVTLSTTASAWKFLTQAQYNAVLAARVADQESAVAAAKGIVIPDGKTLNDVVSDADNWASTFTNDGVPTSGKWTATKHSGRGGNLNWGGYGSEMYQCGDGHYTRTISGLKKGIYKVAIRGMKRMGSNETCTKMGNAGYPVSDTYLTANGNVIRFKAWYEDRVSDSNPNSTSDFVNIVNNGGYTTEGFAYVGDDGNLVLDASSEAFWGDSWFLFNGIGYTYYNNEVSDEDAEALIATIPSHVSDAHASAMATAKTALENNKTIANYNALAAAIADAQTSANEYAIIDGGFVPTNTTAGWAKSTTNGGLDCNTWSTEGNSDGSGMTTPFIQDWVGAGTPLAGGNAGGKLYFSFTDLNPGETYVVTARVRAFNESATGVTGAKYFVGSSSKPLDDVFSSPCVGDYATKGRFAVLSCAGTVDSNGDLQFGVELDAESPINWISIKDVTISAGTGAVPTAIELSETSKSLTTGSSFVLTSTIAPANADDKTTLWSSSDNTVATVAGGTVVALKAGTATITATAYAGDNVNASCTVTVADAAAPSFYSTSIEAKDYYIYNAATGQFLGGANSWGTQASQIEHGIPFTAAIGEGVYTLDSHTYNNANDHFFNGTYVDGASTNLYITPLTDGKFAISTAASAGYVTAIAGSTVVSNTAADANNSLAQWYFLSKEDRDKMLPAATALNPVDATYYVKQANISRNLSAGALNVNAWSQYDVGGEQNNSNFVAQVYNKTVDNYQTIENIPNGTYTVTVQAFTSGSNVKFYANNQKVDVQAKPNGVTTCAQASERFAAKSYSNTVSVTVTNRTLKIGFEGDCTGKWLCYDNVEVYMTNYAADPTPAEKAALVAAIEAAETHTLGFENAEYAPYVNVDAVTKLLAAKAIDPEIESGESIVAATEALTSATWTANEEDVDAICNGSFTGIARGTQDNVVPGWDGVFRKLITTEDYAALSASKEGRAMFSHDKTYVYGGQTGYTMPLKRNTKYALSFKAAGWEDGNIATVSAVIKKPGGSTLKTLNITPTKRINEAESLVSGSIDFTVETSGNYTLEVTVPASTLAVITDFSVERLGIPVLMQVSGVAKMGTFCAPFNVEIPSGVKAYTLSDGTSDDWVHMDEVKGTTIAAGTPVLLTSDTKVEQEFVGQMTVLEPNNDGLLKGVFEKTEVAPDANNYILQYQDSKCAFYIVSDAGIYIGKNRCYLHVAKTSARIAIDREEDGFTGINEVKSVEAEARTMKDGKYFVKGRIIVVKNGKVYGTNGQILN